MTARTDDAVTAAGLASPALALPRRMAAEFLGAGLLCAVVIGSGIAASRLSPGDVGLQLLENAWATALGLGVLIVVLAPVSGAHLNPVISVADSLLGLRAWRDTLAYIPVQVLGCIAGAVLANLMFGEPAITISETARATPATFLSEIVATAGLVLVVFSLARSGRANLAPLAVGAYIGGAYFFTSSTSFANPAITIGRIFSDSFAGIAPASAPWFLAAEVIGGAVGYALVRLLHPTARQRAASH